MKKELRGVLMTGGQSIRLLLRYLTKYQLWILEMVVGTMYLVDVVKRLVKMRALRLSVESRGKEPLDLLDDESSDQKVDEKINGLKNRFPTVLLVSLKEYITWILKKPQLQCLRLIQWSHY